MKQSYFFLWSLFILFIVLISVISSNQSQFITNQQSYFWPTPSYHQITSYFGYRHSPTSGASTYHQGVDIAAKEGSGVSVMADGEVIYAAFHPNGGNMIIVQHDDKMKSYYEHLAEEMYVQKGDRVQKGEVIGKVGPKILSNGKQNGVTTGAHLHFGIYQNGTYRNPLSFF